MIVYGVSVYGVSLYGTSVYDSILVLVVSGSDQKFKISEYWRHKSPYLSNFWLSTTS